MTWILTIIEDSPSAEYGLPFFTLSHPERPGSEDPPKPCMLKCEVRDEGIHGNAIRT